MTIKKNSYKGRFLYFKTRLAANLQDFILKYTKGAAPILTRMIGEYPYVIKLDVVEACNLACKMCYAKKDRTVPLEKLFSILNQFKSAPVRLDLLGGEPLVRPDLSELVKYAKKHTGIKEVTLYTNGTLATKEVAEDLFAAGLDRAIVSLISHDPEIHNNFTGAHDAWQRTLSGINNLVNAGIKTYTFSALHSDNIDAIEPLYHFVSNQLGVDPLFYQYIPQKIDDPLLPSPEQWHQCKHKVLYQYSTKHAEYFKRVISCCQTVCLGGKYALSIKLDGTVTPCPFIHDLVLGNVYQQNIWDIFANRHSVNLFRDFIKLPEGCTACTYRYLCGGGCRAGNQMLFGSYLTKDCRCLGPYYDRVADDRVADRMPTFF